MVLATYVDIFVVRASLCPGSSWMLPTRGAMAAACSPEGWQHRAEIDEPACLRAPLRHLFTVDIDPADPYGLPAPESNFLAGRPNR